MTSLISRKSRLCFMSEDTVRYRGKDRRVVVEVDTQGRTASFRLEHTRQRYPLSFAGMWNRAVQVEVDKQRAVKAAAKKGKK